MTAPRGVPDLIIPNGRIQLQTVAEGRAVIEINEAEELEVIIPAGTTYFLNIGKTFVARWRPGTTVEGLWSFWCEVGSEKAWLETDGTSWQINHSIAAPDGTQPHTPLGS